MFKVFEEVDIALSYSRNDRFPVGTYDNFKYEKIDPWKILRKIPHNAYKLDLSKAFGIYPIFNIYDIYEFHEEEEDGGVGTMKE